MKKFLITMLCVIMVIAMMPAIAFAEEVTALAGSGSEADPYLISTIDELKFFRDSVNAGETTYNAEGVYVALGADIDMAGEDWSVNIGDDCNATFDGIFDGKDYTIYNLTSTEAAQKADGYICTGLFGAIYGSAVVKNFTIENATIDTGDYTGNNAGVVVGFAYNATGSIENVHVTGNVTVNADKVDGTGAIVGYAYGGSLNIEGCSVETSVINGQAYVGGIIGYAGGMTTVIGCSVSDTDVNASSCIAGGAGGFIAAGGVVSDCSIESVDLTAAHENWKASAAAVVGSNGGSLYISDCTITDVTANTEPTDMELGCKWVNHPTEAVPGYEAKIDGNYYTSLEDAVDAVESGETITLLTDTEKTVEVPLGVTLDTNGKTAENVTLVPGVASMNGVNYGTLQAALDAANAAPGDYEIVLASGTLDEDVIIHQTEGVNITIKGNGTDTVFTGYIEIYGHARHNGAETLTFDGVVFQTTENEHTFIEQTCQTGTSVSQAKCYPHNVTVKNCTFTATGDALKTAVGMKYRYGYNIKVMDTTAAGMHSLMQNYAGVGLTIENVTITGGKNGIALGTSQNVTVENATIVAEGYGLRADAQIATTITVADSDIEAFIPVVVRKAEKEVEVVFNGTNEMTATNDDGIWCAIGTSEYEENGNKPTAPSGTIDVTLNDADLAEEGIYPREGEKAPDIFVASKLTTDIAGKEFIVGEPTEFTFTTVANDHVGQMVIGTSNFSNAAAIEKLEYYEVSNGQWYELSGEFGPGAGFPMADATSKFRVTFKTAGTYTFTASMKLANGGAELCSTEVEFTVKNKVVPETPTYYPTVTIEKPVVESAENATVTLGILGTTATISAVDGYEIVDVTVNGVSKGAVTSLSGLKTGDKIVVITKAIEPEAPAKTEAELVQEELDGMELVARSKATKSPKGKAAILITWYDKAGAELDFDGVEIYRSTKKGSGYKKVFTSKTDKYYNTAIEEGVKYYYKVRGYVTVDGEKLYTDWSLKAIRTAK